jgi:hypothetical protein
MGKNYLPSESYFESYYIFYLMMCMSRILEFFIVIMKRYFQDGKTWVSMRKRVKDMNDEEVKKLIKEIEEDHTEDFVKHKKIEIIQQI